MKQHCRTEFCCSLIWGDYVLQAPRLRFAGAKPALSRLRQLRLYGLTLYNSYILKILKFKENYIIKTYIEVNKDRDKLAASFSCSFSHKNSTIKHLLQLKNIATISNLQSLEANLKLENRENLYRLAKTIASSYFYFLFYL